MRVFWTWPARADLENIVRYIAIENVDAAFEIEDDVRAATSRLADMPRMGRLGRAAETRELVVVHTPYVVIYRIQSDQVEILRVMHGAQNWPPKET